jgi:hypothetical protein
MKKLLILALLITMFGCKNQSDQSSSGSTADDPSKSIKEKEGLAASINYDNLGELITTISFEVSTANKDVFEDGIIPWASIEKPEEDIPNLIDGDKIVISQTVIRVFIDYPLNNPYEFTLISEKGFSRRQLLEEISKHYYKVFEEEEASATVKTIPIDKRTTMYNRNETNGKYGIWGHDIADLDLSQINVYRTANNEIVLSLDVES